MHVVLHRGNSFQRHLASEEGSTGGPRILDNLVYIRCNCIKGDLHVTIYVRIFILSFLIPVFVENVFESLRVGRRKENRACGSCGEWEFRCLNIQRTRKVADLKV